MSQRRHLPFLPCLWPILLFSVAPGPLSAQPSVAAHRQEVEEWRAERHAGLLKPDGWLSLVGLHWLSDGLSTCGSAEGSDVPLPDSVPAQVGEFLLQDDKVLFTAAPESGVSTADGTPVESLIMATDASEEATTLRVGSVLFFLIERGDRIGVRVKDAESPVLREFEGMESFPIDPAWRLEARFEAYDPPKKMGVPDVLGSVNEVECPGAVVFTVDGEEYRIDAMPSGDEYFLVFGDTTSGKETYGGGRFLYTPIADAEGRVIVDFNKAYNPPCVFTPWATCPLPPRQNKLAVAIRAGEKAYGPHH